MFWIRSDGVFWKLRLTFKMKTCQAPIKDQFWTKNQLLTMNNFCPQSIKTEIHWGQKRSARSRFFKANFDGFWQFSQKVLKIQKLYIPHLKALIYSYYEPEGQGVWCLHMTARLLRMKLELFSLKGVWQICLEGHALYHWGSKELNIRAFQWGI